MCTWWCSSRNKWISYVYNHSCKGYITTWGCSYHHSCMPNNPKLTAPKYGYRSIFTKNDGDWRTRDLPRENRQFELICTGNHLPVCKRGFPSMGIPPVIIHFNRIFPYTQSTTWGSPMNRPPSDDLSTFRCYPRGCGWHRTQWNIPVQPCSPETKLQFSIQDSHSGTCAFCNAS